MTLNDLPFDPDPIGISFGEVPPPVVSPPLYVPAALRNGHAAETRPGLPFCSAKEFAERTPSSPPWLVSGYLARGTITELVGKVKAAGKTTLVLAMCSAVVQGIAFAGRRTEPTRVVYLTEQPRASFREALARATLLTTTDVTVLSWHDAAGRPWAEVAAETRGECRRLDAGLLVVDTLPQWAGIRGDGENNSGEALRALEPLQEAAGRDGLGVIVVRHSRKSGGDVGDDGRGSSAFAGAVDIVLSLRRPEGQASTTVRVLHALSRFSETPETLALELTPAGYAALGDEAAFTVEIAKRRILDVVPVTEADALPGDELIERAKVRRTSGQEAIAALRELRLLERIGGGKRGSPYRYWSPQSDSAATSTLKAAETLGAAPEGHSLSGTGKLA